MENKIIKYKGDLIKHVGNALKITDKLLPVNLRSLKILILDDHLLYSESLSKCILKHFPNATFKFIQNGNEAFEYVTTCLENKEILDLITTDIVHMGMSGIEFANAVRLEEAYYGRIIPILFITMQDDESFIKEAGKLSLTKYFSKAVSEEEIISFIHYNVRK